jgi:beta-glucanase (GH16 family)
MNKLKVIHCIFILSIALSCTRRAADANGYSLIWSDEFEINGKPSELKWTYDVGDGCPNNCNWGNNELQFYTNGVPKNVRIESGHLIIEAHKEKIGNKDYTSTRMTSKNLGDWKYGKIEISAKLPQGKGIWPAFWMLPTDWEYGGWPESGEIDIMEHVGFTPDSVFATVHTKSFNHVDHTQSSKAIHCKTLSTKFHTYGIEWNENKIDFFFDHKKYSSFNNNMSGFEAWPFDKKFHAILNLAVGGNWGGKMGVDPNIWPQKFTIDYIRVYQKNKI